MNYFDDMNTRELQYCLKYLDFKKKREMNKQAEEDRHQRTQILKAIRTRNITNSFNAKKL